MIPEEIEDYFLEISDINSECRTNGFEPIQMELVKDPFVSVQVVSKYKKEIIFELEEPIECKSYTDSNSGIAKFKQRIVEHPCIMSTKTVSCDTMKIIYSNPSKMDKKIRKIVDTAITRLKLYYEVSDYKREYDADDTIISFSIISKDEYKEFQKLVHSSKETHDVKISTKAFGINNYWSIDRGK